MLHDVHPIPDKHRRRTAFGAGVVVEVAGSLGSFRGLKLVGPVKIALPFSPARRNPKGCFVNADR